jgi:hypothetical protein
MELDKLIARIILRIWLKSNYQVTVNCLTTSESVPRVPHDRRRSCVSLAWTEWYRRHAVTLHRRDKNPGGDVSLITRWKFPGRVYCFPRRLKNGAKGILGVSPKWER